MSTETCTCRVSTEVVDAAAEPTVDGASLDETEVFQSELYNEGRGCTEIGVISSHDGDGSCFSVSQTSNNFGRAPKVSLWDPCSAGARTSP